MARLRSTVYVRDPESAGVTVRLDAGQEVPDHLAHLITNPDAWENSEPPAAATDQDNGGGNPAESPGADATDSDTEDGEAPAKKPAPSRRKPTASK